MGASTSGVGDGDGKDGVGLNTTYLTSHKVGCCIDGGTFVLYQSSDFSITSNSYNKKSYVLSNIRRDIIMVLLVMVEVVLVLVTHTSTTNFVLIETG